DGEAGARRRCDLVFGQVLSPSYSSWPASEPAISSPSVLRRTRAHRLLVHVDAPAGASRQHELTVLDARHSRVELIAPGRAVDIDLHHAEVRHDGAEGRADRTAQMPVE